MDINSIRASNQDRNLQLHQLLHYWRNGFSRRAYGIHPCCGQQCSGVVSRQGFSFWHAPHPPLQRPENQLYNPIGLFTGYAVYPLHFSKITCPAVHDETAVEASW
jgi:hypothetical protein